MLVAMIDGGVMPEMFSIGTLKYDMRVTEWGRVRKPLFLPFRTSRRQSGEMSPISAAALSSAVIYGTVFVTVSTRFPASNFSVSRFAPPRSSIPAEVAAAHFPVNLSLFAASVNIFHFRRPIRFCNMIIQLSRV
jgi:hypothetical protein